MTRWPMSPTSVRWRIPCVADRVEHISPPASKHLGKKMLISIFLEQSRCYNKIFGGVIFGWLLFCRTEYIYNYLSRSRGEFIHKKIKMWITLWINCDSMCIKSYLSTINSGNLCIAGNLVHKSLPASKHPGNK